MGLEVVCVGVAQLRRLLRLSYLFEDGGIGLSGLIFEEIRGSHHLFLVGREVETA